VVTYRANGWSLLADNDVTTVAALPDAVAIAREYHAVLDILQELAVTLLVVLLNLTNAAELNSQLWEALFDSVLCHLLVHISPLVVFTSSCVSEVLSSCRDITLVEELEPDLSVLLLVACCLLEEACNLLEAVLLSLLSIVEGLSMCLALTCESVLEVLLSLSTLQCSWVELLKLLCLNVAYWALFWCLCSFVDITTNGANKFLFHNVLVFV